VILIVSPSCQRIHCARCATGSGTATGCGRVANSALTSALSQACKTTLGHEVTPCAYTWPVAGRNRVSSLAAYGHTGRLRLAVCLLDQPFFASLPTSWTVTGPRLRLRTAVPVGHHVRLCCQLQPASLSTHQMV
jgi:hypothetical protein